MLQQGSETPLSSHVGYKEKLLPTRTTPLTQSSFSRYGTCTFLTDVVFFHIFFMHIVQVKQYSIQLQEAYYFNFFTEEKI